MPGTEDDDLKDAHLWFAHTRDEEWNVKLHKVMASRVISNVVKLRKEKGWTQAQLADLAQISEPYQSQLEAGKRDPSLEMVCKFAVALGVDPIRLFKEAK